MKGHSIRNVSSNPRGGGTARTGLFLKVGDPSQGGGLGGGTAGTPFFVYFCGKVYIFFLPVGGGWVVSGHATPRRGTWGR